MVYMSGKSSITCRGVGKRDTGGDVSNKYVLSSSHHAISWSSVLLRNSGRGEDHTSGALRRRYLSLGGLLSGACIL